MRNILIFPDGSKQHFMYPENRDIVIGEQIQGQMNNDSIVIFEVSSIETHGNEIHYILKK
jgi:hypothetical protein